MSEEGLQAIIDASPTLSMYQDLKENLTQTQKDLNWYKDKCQYLEEKLNAIETHAKERYEKRER